MERKLRRAEREEERERCLLGGREKQRSVEEVSWEEVEEEEGEIRMIGPRE